MRLRGLGRPVYKLFWAAYEMVEMLDFTSMFGAEWRVP